MKPCNIPLLSPKPFGDYSPESFREYVTSLYREPERAAPLAEYSVRLNRKGNPVIKVRREPKFLTAEEVRLLATEVGFTQQKMWLAVRERDIEIRNEKKKS